MAKRKRRESEETGETSRVVNWAFGAEGGIEAEDFELEELRRRFTIDKWFTMADEGFPFWTV